MPIRENLPVLLPILGALFALLCLALALRADKLKRLVGNIPTSKTAGVFIGLVELKGTAEAETPLVSYLAGRSCVQYQWAIEEHWSRTVTETFTGPDGKPQTRTREESGWTSVAAGGERIPFYLQDDTGVVRILPEGAKLDRAEFLSRECRSNDPMYYAKGPQRPVTDSDQRRRFSESGIPLHAKIFVTGQARERQDIVAAEIAQDKRAPLFLISTRTQEQVRSGLSGQAWVLGVAGLALCVGGWFGRDQMLHRPPEFALPTYAAAASVFIAATVLGWVWMAYNGLIDLRQRVRQAWAQVDVQLKRRHDLIPNLIQLVTGLRDYEKSVQTEVAALRTQLNATPPGQPGPDPAAFAPVLGSVMERYPELKAQASFMNLHKAVVDSEQRIAVSRSYFNDIATFYNTRLQIVPDRFIADLGRLQPQPLMAANNFERAPVQVNLAQ